MSFLLPGAAMTVPDRAYPVNFGRTHTVGTAYELDVTNSLLGTFMVVTAMDATVTGSIGSQCFCDLVVNTNVVIYHDSQSTGEGQGVSFFWRGQMVLSWEDEISIIISSSLGATISGSLTGFRIPAPPDTF